MVQKAQNIFQTNKSKPSSLRMLVENQPKDSSSIEKVETWLNNEIESAQNNQAYENSSQNIMETKVKNLVRYGEYSLLKKWVILVEGDFIQVNKIHNKEEPQATKKKHSIRDIRTLALTRNWLMICRMNKLYQVLEDGIEPYGLSLFVHRLVPLKFLTITTDSNYKRIFITNQNGDKKDYELIGNFRDERFLKWQQVINDVNPRHSDDTLYETLKQFQRWTSNHVCRITINSIDLKDSMESLVRKEEIQLQDASPDYPKRLSQDVDSKIEPQGFQSNNNRAFKEVTVKEVEELDKNQEKKDDKKCCLKKNKKKKMKCDKNQKSEQPLKAYEHNLARKKEFSSSSNYSRNLSSDINSKLKSQNIFKNNPSTYEEELNNQRDFQEAEDEILRDKEETYPEQIKTPRIKYNTDEIIKTSAEQEQSSRDLSSIYEGENYNRRKGQAKCPSNVVKKRISFAPSVTKKEDREGNVNVVLYSSENSAFYDERIIPGKELIFGSSEELSACDLCYEQNLGIEVQIGDDCPMTISSTSVPTLQISTGINKYCKAYGSSTEHYEEIDVIKKYKTHKKRWWRKNKFKQRSKDEKDTNEIYGVIAVEPA